MVRDKRFRMCLGQIGNQAFESVPDLFTMDYDLRFNAFPSFEIAFLLRRDCLVSTPNRCSTAGDTDVLPVRGVRPETDLTGKPMMASPAIIHTPGIIV